MAALNSFSACERKRVFTVGGRQRQWSCAVIGGHSPAPVGPAERPGWPSEETQGVGYCLSPPPRQSQRGGGGNSGARGAVGGNDGLEPHTFWTTTAPNMWAWPTLWAWLPGCRCRRRPGGCWSDGPEPRPDEETLTPRRSFHPGCEADTQTAVLGLVLIQ